MQPVRENTMLVIQADDLGLDPAVNVAIDDALTHKRLTSTSSIVVSPYFEQATKIIHRHPNASHGLHVTLTCEDDEYGWRALNPRALSLSDNRGLLAKTPKDLINKADPKHIIEEMESQLEHYRRMVGANPTHLDVHMYSCYYSTVSFDCLLQFSGRNQLPIILLSDVMEYHGLPKLSLPSSQTIITKSIRIRGDMKVPNSEWGQTYIEAALYAQTGLFQLTLHPGRYGTTTDDLPFGANWRSRDDRFLINGGVEQIRKLAHIRPVSWDCGLRPGSPRPRVRAQTC